MRNLIVTPYTITYIHTIPNDSKEFYVDKEINILYTLRGVHFNWEK